MKEIWTIGHSNKPLEEFIALLKEFNIELLVDVRGLPGSRKFPWFNSENLAKVLPDEGIEYKLIKELGGRRKVNRDSHNTAWRNPQFRSYADFMETDQFLEGIKELTILASKKRTAYMCSEVLWWRCHRSMISDYLKVNGWKVFHIMAPGKIQEHPYTSAAKIVNGKLDYTGT